MITNNSCTVFNCFQGIDGAFSKHFIPAVYWRETQNLESSGVNAQSGDEVTVIIPIEMLSEYCSPTAFCGDGWTIQKKDYIYLGNAEFDISKNTVGEIKKNYHILTVTSCEELFYGSKRLWHLKLKAR